MNRLFFFALMFFCISASAQNLSNKSIKLYLNASVNDDYFRTNGLDAFYLTPALVVKKDNGDFWEFEVSHMKFRDYNQKTDEYRAIAGGNVKEIELFLRAEFNHRFLKSRNSKFRPILGMSLTPFFQWHSYRSFSLQNFPFDVTKMGAYLSVVPRLEYHFNERFFMDLNMPIALVSGRYVSEFDQNPLLILEERRVTEFKVDNFTGFGLRLGVGVVL